MITGVALAAASAGVVNAADADNSEDLVVTGSRIPQPNLTSVSPVTSVTSQDVKLQGTTNVEDFLNNLPQVFADYGAYVSNGSTGTATVDLRGLGPSRTLVLIDGKRLQPGDPTEPVADLNFIPAQLIDRVDVLTGGASAVYGSDAVAGVVNFVMKKNFQGVEIDGQTSIAETGNSNAQVRRDNAFGHSSFGFPLLNLPNKTVWDGIKRTVTIIGGVNSADDKGNVEAYFSYTSTQAVNEGTRDYSACSVATNNTNTTQQYCGGSSTAAPGRYYPQTGPNASPAGGRLGYLIQPAAAAGSTIDPLFGYGNLYNYAPSNYFQRPDTRYTAGQFSHYEISKAVDLYSSFMFMDDHSVAAIAPSGSFYGDSTYTIPCADPLLSAAEANTLCGPGPYAPGQTASALLGRRDVEGGPRIDDLEHEDYRIVIGSKGDIGSGWSYDISAQYGRSMLTSIEGGYFLKSHLVNALNVVSVNGTPTCQSVVSGTDTACVPYNIWTPGGVTQAAVNYLSGTAISSGATDQQVVTGSITGDLGHYGIKSPMADHGVGVSFGAEYTRDHLETQYDTAYTSGDLAGFGGSVKDTSGSQADKSIFAEIRAPLIQDVTFIKDLTFDGGYRYSDYTSGGGNSTYKVGLEWQVIPDFKFRGSYERAVRAPNVQELFDPATPGLVSGSDPCAGAAPSYTAAQCFNTITHSAPNLTLAQFTNTIYGNIPPCISGQCGDISGGNPNLKPEVGKTASVGFVFTPTFFKGFTLTVDYFHIVVDNVITTLSLDTVLNNCAVSDIAADCDLIIRNPGVQYAIFGGLGAGAVELINVNNNSLKTDGLDVDASYHTTFSDMGLGDWGGLSFHFEGTYVHTATTTEQGGSYDCAGLYGVTCGTPTPKWRHQFRTTWTTPWNLVLSVNWRYLEGVGLDFNTNQSLLQNGFKDVQPTDAHIPEYSYFDLSMQYKIKDRYTLRAGVNNVFNRTPPILDSNSFGISAPPFGNGNTYPQVYDPLGRVLFVGLTADF
jgi:outer membrane receptor protein involved in Fe transport